MTSSVDLQSLKCKRPGCGDRYTQHAPGGAGCRWCQCPGFRWVELEPAPGADPGYPRPAAQL